MAQIIVQTALLSCSQQDAFEMFTSNTQLEKWLTLIANVEAKEGGKYELFWEPSNKETNSTIGCKILAIEKPNYLNFEWKGPKQFEHFMNNIRPLTNITVSFFPQLNNQCLVVLLHTGWREGEEWQQAKEYFENAWKSAFCNLEKLVNDLKQ